MNETPSLPPSDAVWAKTTPRWKFRHPSTILVSGPTGSGKTVTMVELIKRGMFEPLPKHVVVFHGEEQELYEQLPPGTKFIKGWSSEAVESIPQDSLLIIDDLMSEVKNCKYLSKLFTKMSHHRNITVVWLTQHLFPKGSECREISVNSQYMLLFRNPRDKRQITDLAAQMFPGRTKDFLETFNDATEKPFDPVLLILRQEQPDHLRIMRHILSKKPQYIEL